MLNKDELAEIKGRLSKATPGPWTWAATEQDPQLEGNVKHADMNPILVAGGCGNQKGDIVKGCMPEKLNDPLRACPLHPSAEDRDFIANARFDIERLLAHIEKNEDEDQVNV